jgi:L-ascorbate metabolism protein UlaG (beta-lactamase superfamily)
MKITKLGHCCLVIEEQGLKILTDPGDLSTAQNEISGLDVVLITHEHGDHLHVESLKVVLKNNPQAQVFTNRGVGEILNKEGITYQLLENGQSQQLGDLVIEGHGQKHAPIYPSVKDVDNVGYFINNKFFYPGDNFTDPGREVEILALPVSAPWLKLAEAIDYAKLVKPKVCFPVHDGALKTFRAPHSLPAQELPSLGIKFIIPELGVPFAI